MTTIKEKDKKKSLMKALSLTSLGWELAIPIFGGVLIGYQIDRFFDTGFTFSLILLVFGIIVAYFNLYRHIELEMLRKKVADQAKEEDNNA
jgi:predicted F0F1-ATPase subunit